MSTNKSAHLGLHLWEPEDKFLRTEFNENSEKVDTAAGIWPVQLLDVTTQEEAKVLELDVSHIDFTAYLELTMYVMGPVDLGDYGYPICLRCNGLEEGYAWARVEESSSLSESTGYVKVGSSKGNPMLRLTFPVGVTTERAIVASSCYLSFSKDVSGRGTFGVLPVTWGELKSFQFSFGYDAPSFPPATRFLLRGIKR